MDAPSDEPLIPRIPRDYLIAGLVVAAPGTVLIIGALIMEFGGCAGDWPSMCGTGAPIVFLILTLGLGVVLVAGGGPPFAAILGRDLGYLATGACMTLMVAILHFAVGLVLWRIVKWIRPKLDAVLTRFMN